MALARLQAAPQVVILAVAEVAARHGRRGHQHAADEVGHTGGSGLQAGEAHGRLQLAGSELSDGGRQQRGVAGPMASAVGDGCGQGASRGAGVVGWGPHLRMGRLGFGSELPQRPAHLDRLLHA